jgi:hypothetical protein
MSISIERKLPEELLANVVSMATPACLWSLCCTSKTFNRIATPFLYANISLCKDGSLALVPFAHTIISSPEYAKLVTTVTIFEYWGAPDEDGDPKNIIPWPRPGPELEKTLRGKCAEFAANKKEADQIYDKIASAQNQDALLALLLVRLPNVAKLDINFGFCELHADFAALLEKFTNQNKLMNNLHVPFATPLDVMVKGTYEKYPNEPDSLAVFFNLPNLHAIYGWKMGNHNMGLGEERDDSFTRLKPRSCPVEYIELRTSKLHQTNLQLLMDATIPGKLRTFSYEIGCTWAWCNVEHPAIMRNLRAHHNTLLSLGLSHEDYYPYADNSDEKPYPVTFKPFKALIRLKAAPVYIWGHDGMCDRDSWIKPTTQRMLLEALPRNLEELWITRAEPQDPMSHSASAQFIPDCLLPALQLVIQRKSASLPKLSRLRMEFSLSSWRSGWLDPLVSLCIGAEANDVKVTLIITDISQHPDDNGYYERAWGWDEDVHWEECVNNSTFPKTWIDVAEEEDLGQMLHGARSRLVEGKDA